MKNKEHLQEESLDFKGMAIAAVGIITVISAVVFGFHRLNEIRRTEVIDRYTQSVNKFIETNGTGVQALLSNVIDTCQRKFDETNKPGTYLQSIECLEAKAQLDQLDKSALKDSSATAFLRLNKETGSTQIIEASGRFHGNQAFNVGYRFNHTNDLERYIVEGEEINRWQDFLYTLPGKEVVVPIKDNDQVLGYMLLSVIEK